MSRKIRLAVLVFVFVNLASAAYSLPLSGRQVSLRSENVLAAAWGWFEALFTELPGQARLQENRSKAGSSMDPNGCHEAFVIGSECKAGSHMDPDGNH